jgi:hypothetical protein
MSVLTFTEGDLHILLRVFAQHESAQGILHILIFCSLRVHRVEKREKNAGII